jgi:branched-chain amino acid transport system substrate-binding protein
MIRKSTPLNRRAVLGGFAGAVGVAAVGPGRAAPAGQPLRIGSTLALTGPLAQTSLIHKTVGEIYVAELNKKDGLLGRPVEWVLLDDQSKPDVARSLYEKLITVDKTDLILGPYGTGNILAAMGVAQRYSKMLIHGTFGMPHLANYDMQFPASTLGPAPNKSFPPRLFDLLAASPTPPKSITILTSKFPSAQFISTGAREAAEQRGLKVALYLEYEFGTRDYGAIAARVKDANADVLWVGSLGLESNQVLEALKKLDYTPPRHFHLFPAPGPLAVSPDAKNALAFTYFEEHPPYTSNKGAAEIIPLYKAKAAEVRIPYPFFDFQAAAMLGMWQVLEAAVTATKGIDDKAIAQWLKTNQVDSIFGKLRFDGPHNQPPDTTGIKQLIDRRWVAIWPKEIAQPGVKPNLP